MILLYIETLVYIFFLFQVLFSHTCPGANVKKLFTAVIYNCLQDDRVFVPSKLLQSSLIYGRPEPTRVKDLLGASLEGRFLALPKNVILDWIGLRGTSTIWLRTFVKYGRKKFCNNGPRFQYFKSFLTLSQNKLVRLSKSSLFSLVSFLGQWLET
jgi:hypothetical protein